MSDILAIRLYFSLHLLGVILVYLGYGGLIFRAAMNSDDKGLRKFGGMVSGIGLFMILLGGFGMHARYGYSHGDFWFIAKFVLFLLLGSSVALINRMPKMNKIWLIWTLILGLAAAYLGKFKPNFASAEPVDTPAAVKEVTPAE